MTWRVCLCLEPGLPHQPSALAVVGKDTAERLPVHEVRHLERFLPGTPYPDLAERVVALLNTPELDEKAAVLIDRTGVGRSVYRHLLGTLYGRVTAKVSPVTVTTGLAPPPSGLVVPRRELAGTLQVLLQTRRLRVPPALPHAEVLTRELGAFTLKLPVVDLDDLAAWRQGAQDDLVLAVGLAAWLCEEVYHVVRHG